MGTVGSDHPGRCPVTTIAAAAVAFVLTVAYIVTEHPLLFVALAVAAVVLAWVGLRDDPDELAPYKFPGGDL